MFYSSTALPNNLKRKPAFLIDINTKSLKSSFTKHSSLYSLLTATKLSIIGFFLVCTFPHCFSNTYQFCKLNARIQLQK